MSTQIRPQFWQHYTLAQLNPAEWEALCDGCGLCCLLKLQDEENHLVFYTNVACKLLDCQSGACKDYANRWQYVPDCLKLDLDLLQKINWLPKSCAYRLRHEGKPLPDWHPLISGDRQSVIKAKKSVVRRCVSENDVAEDELEEHIVRWVKF